MNNEERKNSRKAFIISLSVHIILALIALYAVSCWKAPGPPWPEPEIGVEVDFGLDNVGSGDIKNENTPTEAEEVNEDPQETDNPEPTENTEEVTEPTETQPTEAVPTEDAPAEPSDAAVETYEAPSPVTEKPKPAAPKPSPKPTDKPADTYKPSSSSSSASNNGDNANEVGDKGDPNSTKPTDVYEGKAGGGDDGLSLKIAGWDWEKPPRENRITHSGQIVFKFSVDEYGEVRGIQVVSSSFTPEEEKWLKERLATIMFRQTSSGRPPEFTEGTLVWKFKAR